ncbi:MAG: hypothetical protein AB7K63_09935 [Vicinamibacterales bacterium]
MGGFLLGLPIVAGPTLGFYAVEQGSDFAAVAVRATLLGLVAVGVFCVVYAHIARRAPWPVCLALGWSAFGIVTAASLGVSLPLIASFAAAVAALFAARSLLPASTDATPEARPPRWDLVMRMVSAALLVTILTAAADSLGPLWSGVLTPFPVAVSIMVAFTHARNGAGAAARFLYAFLPGLATFAVFCLVLALTLNRWPVAVAFAMALGVQMCTQGAYLARS